MNTSQHQPNKILQLAFPEKTNRKQHLIRTIVYLVIAALVIVLWNLILMVVDRVSHINQNGNMALILEVIPVSVCGVYYAVGMLLPRVRSIGWSPWTLFQSKYAVGDDAELGAIANFYPPM